MAAPEPIFGVFPVPNADDRDQLVEQVLTAERVGLDLVGIQDHPYQRRFLETFTLIAYLAARTERIRFFPDVGNLPLRNPAVIAKMAATIDLLSGGRFELGLGAGHMETEYAEAGIDYEPARVRVERLGEAAQVLRQLLAGEDCTFSGRHYRVAGHRVFPRPVQKHVPLLVGGNGRGVLTLAGRTADIVGFTGFSHTPGGGPPNLTHFNDSGLAGQISWVRAAAGKRFASLELSTLVQSVHLTESPADAIAAITAEDPSLRTADLERSPYILIGSPAGIAEQLLERRERLGVSYVTVFEKDLGAFASIIERLA